MSCFTFNQCENQTSVSDLYSDDIQYPKSQITALLSTYYVHINTQWMGEWGAVSDTDMVIYQSGMI